MVENLINKFKHLPNDKIGQDIYIAYEWSDNILIRIYIGTKQSGPTLQYDADGRDHYNGKERIDFKNGCWTNCYSRGNFGHKYAFGGNWSGHTKNLHTKLKLSPIMDKKYEMLIDNDSNGIILPSGIKGDITVTDMDCTGSWSIWYNTAKDALNARLNKKEIAESSLPKMTKNHLIKTETNRIIDNLNDVIETYEL